MILTPALYSPTSIMVQPSSSYGLSRKHHSIPDISPRAPIRLDGDQIDPTTMLTVNGSASSANLDPSTLGQRQQSLAVAHCSVSNSVAPLRQQSLESNNSIAQQVRLAAARLVAASTTLSRLNKPAPSDWFHNKFLMDQQLTLKHNMAAENVLARPSRYELYDHEIQPMDVLYGRGGKSNNHLGNKCYRQLISHVREQYQETKGRKAKTDMGYSVVDFIEAQGGRFLRRNNNVKTAGASGYYYIVVNKAEARRKTSQALREKPNNSNNNNNGP
jgi:hypothetical protein